MEFEFQLDSLLIQKQVTGVWQCKAPTLVKRYEEALALLRVLRSRGSHYVVRHIYREFNAEADGLASWMLDTGCVMLKEAWRA